MRRITRRPLLLGAAAGLATPAIVQAQTGEIPLGVTVPLTGPLAGSGQQYHFSLQLARDDINAAGGINGRRVRMVFEDTQASNSIAVNAFVKLVRELNPPFVFLSSLSTQNLATEPEVTRAQIPVMYAGGADVIHERRNPFMFRLRPYDTVTTTALAKTVIERVGARRPGLIYVQDDFGQGSANIIEGLFQRAGLTVAGKESYGARDNDVSAQLLNLRNRGADCIVAFSYIRDGALVISGRRSLGINLPMVTSGSTTLPATLALLEPADLQNLYSTTDAFLDASQGPKVADYVERFQRRFNLRPDPFGSCYYDGAMILADIMRRVGPDRAAIRAALAQLNGFEGVTQTFRADQFGNLAHATTVVRFRPGTKDFELVERVSLL
jgi:branched-chain amino acid transport system substrate-binding protein